MPISLSAKKSLRKSIKNNKDNRNWKNKYKDLVKKFMTKFDAATLSELYSMIDKLGQRNIFHKNKAKRLKAKYSRKMKKSGSKIEKPVEKKIVKKDTVKKIAKKKTAIKKKTKKSASSADAGAKK